MKKCNCWDTRDAGIRKRYKLKISDACYMLSAETYTRVLGIPLERLDGKKFQRSDPKIITISYCPFCGAKYEDSK